MEDGFDIHELDNFTKDLLALAEKELPKETKKFIKKNANQLKTATKNKAKQVGIIDQTGNYYSHFKTGKVYKYQGYLSCRVYNGAAVANSRGKFFSLGGILENGHMKENKKGFIPGFHPFEKAYQDFMGKYYGNCEDFIDDMLKNKGL